MHRRSFLHTQQGLSSTFASFNFPALARPLRSRPPCLRARPRCPPNPRRSHLLAIFPTRCCSAALLLTYSLYAPSATLCLERLGPRRLWIPCKKVSRPPYQACFTPVFLFRPVRVSHFSTLILRVFQPRPLAWPRSGKRARGHRGPPATCLYTNPNHALAQPATRSTRPPRPL
ncbi:hypothetical protein IWX50DRAFT_631023 [Phyllosticta citricarpa]